MGVDFFLYRRKRRKMPKSDIALPEIEARFASAEYTRFLSQLAHDAGVGEVWDNHQQAISTVSKALAKQVNDALLRSPISARWGLDKRAEAISKKFENGTIEIDGKPTPARMVNGKSYSNETIKGWIIGT